MPDEVVASAPSESISGACAECGGTLTRNQEAVFCSDCGLVQDRATDTSLHPAPGKSRGQESETSVRHDDGVSTSIGFETDSDTPQLRRLRRIQSGLSVQSNADRNKIRGLITIRRLGDKLDLGQSTVEEACSLFKKAMDDPSLDIPATEIIAAAALSVTCRRRGIMRPVDDFVDGTSRAESDIRLGSTLLQREYDLEVPPLTPQFLIPYYISELKLPTIRREAMNQARLFEEEYGLSGYDPHGICGAAIYEAAGGVENELISQRELANTLDISPQTLRRRHVELRKLN